MIKKCDANCDATHQNLWLRGNIFYYRVELPREDNKRRYKRISLHTDSFIYRICHFFRVLYKSYIE